jgi:hypothetical protein
MASITFALDDKFKPKIDKFAWVNWSETAREELIKREQLAKDFKRFKEIISKSKFTLKDAKELADKAGKSMHERLVKEGLI